MINRALSSLSSSSSLLKSTPLFRKMCQKSWDSYRATGRGCLELFQLIDTDDTNHLSASEVRTFLDNLHPRDVNESARRELHSKSSDHLIDYPEFQNWLIRATNFDTSVSHCLKENYNKQPSLGDRCQKQLEEYSWNASTMSQSIRRMQYAVRGEVVMRADELADDGREVIYTNIGNPHAVGQKPLKFYREVMALCDLPPEYGIDNSTISAAFPSDVVERARRMHDAIGPAGTGAYTNSQGVLSFRRDVARFIEERDGHPAFEGDVFLTNGASAAIEMVMTALIATNKDAIMVPIPQYPIYSALISRLGGRQVGYFLDEDLGWKVTEEELERQLNEAKEMDLNVKALVVINPGNPTGQVLDNDDLELICHFCTKHNIVLLSDEVYQRNVYAEDKKFISAKKVACDSPNYDNLELISFHSTSKGVIGECGRRGGYMELRHIDPYVQSQLYKLASSGLCAGVPGQIMTSLMVTPPQKGDESYEQFKEEDEGIFRSLSRRARALASGLNAIDGIDCNDAEGAMYVFPRISVSPSAWDEAEKRQKSVDTLYALSLLEETGICVVPASGFGQMPGRMGFRTTFLPSDDQMNKAIGEFKRHHELFCERYRG